MSCRVTDGNSAFDGLRKKSTLNYHSTHLLIFQRCICSCVRYLRNGRNICALTSASRSSSCLAWWELASVLKLRIQRVKLLVFNVSGNIHQKFEHPLLLSHRRATQRMKLKVEHRYVQLCSPAKLVKDACVTFFILPFDSILYRVIIFCPCLLPFLLAL